VFQKIPLFGVQGEVLKNEWECYKDVLLEFWGELNY